MVKREFKIAALESSSLLVGFTHTLNVNSAEFDHNGNNISLLPRHIRDNYSDCTAANPEEVSIDIGFKRPLKEPDEIWQIRELKAVKRKALIVNQYTSAKPGNDKITTPSLEGNVVLKNIPTKWFHWKPFNQSFMDIYQETLESIPDYMESDLTYTSSGHTQMVLRPSNQTHALLAFIVTNPELFRFTLFDIIVTEVKSINAKRRKGEYVTEFQKSLCQKIKQCGLEVISDNTFGQEGVYGDKFTDPDMWALTPYIDGEDVRIIKAGKDFFMHLGWHKLKRDGALIIEPELILDSDGPLLSEVIKVMDNCITPLSGSMDLRLHSNGTFYFLETSHCFSAERYSESFAKKIRDNILDVLIEKYDLLIGDYNDGWEERVNEYLKALNDHEKTERNETDIETKSWHIDSEN